MEVLFDFLIVLTIVGIIVMPIMTLANIIIMKKWFIKIWDYFTKDDEDIYSL